MAKISFDGGDDFGRRLERLGRADITGSIRKAVARGAAPVADAIRNSLNGLQTVKDIHLAKGQKLHGLQEREKKDLQKSLGITPVKTDRQGFTHVKVGFDGYGSHPTRAYPQGVPNQLVAAATESGSSVRQKHPFVRPAVKKTRDEAIRVMDESVSRDMEEIFEN